MSHRTQITLSDAQYELLREESARSGRSLAELVRNAVDRSYGSATRNEVLVALDDSFGGWSDETLDETRVGEAYVERLRPGMGRRLERS